MRLPEVLIPVFNAIDSLENCLGSIRDTTPDAAVCVIDDGSTDPGIRPMLERWAASSRHYRLLTNTVNQGFVTTVNRGLGEISGDVVVLNSDTLVTPGWLDSLGSCLASDPGIATATPWTNNGEIVSFPRFCMPNPVPDRPGAVADAARASKASEYPEIPTAVGFCMAVSRIALERIGPFDADTFGRGYGEENDFSLRAVSAGLRNVLCDDAYVVHIGGQSFGPLGLGPGHDSMQRLLSKHPGYLTGISAWIEADPLAQRRAAMLEVLESVRW